MSQFPRRLIDELGEGDARRLLESARSDEPPAKLVATAIATATKSTSGAPSTSSTGAADRRSGTGPSGAGPRGRNLALLAGALVIGAAAVVAGSRELGPQQATTPPASTPPTLTETSGPNEAPNDHADPPVAAEVTATAVADLPDAPAPRAPASSVQAKNDVQAADLLREANRLRARGQWAAAAATYQKVIDLGPDSAEAYPADVALGNLELQQGRPLAALARYDHALAKHPNGALTEEARWGRARALRAAGRIAEERGALEEFQRRHPDSPLAPAAAQRLAEIGN